MRRWICVILIAALGVSLWYIASITYDPLYGAVDEETRVVEGGVADDGDARVLTLWYTDEALEDYLSSVALSFQQNSGIKVNIVKKAGTEYLETINRISVEDPSQRVEAMPDLYITSHDNLLRAYLAGIATPVDANDTYLNEKNFPQTALNAVTCYGRNVGFPLYYETNYFLYNKTYMASIAQSKIETEEDRIEGEEAEKETEEGQKPDDSDEKQSDGKQSDGNESDDNGGADGASVEGSDADKQADDGEEDDDPMGDEEAVVNQEVLDRLANMIPSTMEDVMTFANNYDAPDAVESVFKWDVTDIFYNYFFVGNYVAVGGDDGDNAAVFNIYNTQAVECLKAYQDMNKFFTIDPDVDTYDSILQDFIDGKMVFTVATTDAIAKINEAKRNGDFPYEYGVTTMPDINSLLKTRGLSVTDAVAINGYSEKISNAESFAQFMVMNKSDELYQKANKVACNLNTVFEDEEIYHILEEYKKSVPLPKMVEAANYWVQLEIAFTKIWNGGDPDENLKALSDTIGAQIEEIRANLPTQESFSAGAGKFVQ